MTDFAPREPCADLISDLYQHELDAELRAQVVVDVALRHDLEPFALASWIFKPLPPGRRLKVPGIRRWSLSDDVELQAPDYQVPPILGESAWSFASRTATANGYIGAADVRRFAMHYLNWHRNHVESAAYKWFLLAPRFSAEVAEWLDGRTAVRWSIDRWQSPRPFCPDCIRREVVFKECWEREGAQTCEEHGVLLQSRCASCGDELTWTAGSIHACQCGAEFRRGHVSRRIAHQPSEQRDVRVLLEPLGVKPLAALNRESVLAETVGAVSATRCHFGWCSCNAVSIELGGAPIAMGLCHCTECKTTTGGTGLAFLEYSTDRVSVRGDTARFPQGSSGVRVACRFCGQLVLSSRFESGRCRVHPGVLEVDDDLFDPQFEQWVCQRSAWLPALPVPQFQRMRGDDLMPSF